MKYHQIIKEQPIKYYFLSQKPQYITIASYLSFGQWYLNRKLPFEVNNKAYAQRAKKDNHIPTTIIAVAGEFPVGIASLKNNDLWHRKDLNPWLASLFVHEKFRHKKVATNLITRIVEHGKKLGFNKVYLFLGNEEQHKLEKFYTSLGWQFESNEKDNDGNQTKVYFYQIEK